MHNMSPARLLCLVLTLAACRATGAADKQSSIFYPRPLRETARVNASGSPLGSQLRRLVVRHAQPWLELSEEQLWGSGRTRGAVRRHVRRGARHTLQRRSARQRVAGGRLFTLGISGILSAWSADTGPRLWQREFARQFPNASPLYGTANAPPSRWT